jgi:multidrug efflux system outer membrane protein
MTHPPIKLMVLTAMAMVLSGCASLTPDGGVAAVQTLAAGRAGVGDAALSREPTPAAQQAIQALLMQQPLSADAAMRIALLNNPGLQASLSALGASDAQRVQEGRLPAPHFSIGRFREGDKIEIERFLRLDVLGLLTLPWRAEYAGQQADLARRQAAVEVVKLAADTRKAWVHAVAARQTAAYMRDVKEAAEAGAELARRLARVGNWSKLNQAREQSVLADATAQLARAEQAAFASREHLTRLMGLWGTQTLFTLPERLPDLPAAAREINDVEAQALGQRLDVQSAQAESLYVAQSMGLTRATGFINALDIGYGRNTTFNNANGERETRRGYEVEFPIPIFDWGQSRNARAQAMYLQSAAKLREVAINARSEAREAYHGYRTAYDVARHYRDEVVPLRKFIADEMVLRYNGMLSSVFELLADTRTHVLAVNGSIEALRDYWLADADLQTALSGTSPGGMTAMKAAGPAGGADKGH